MAHRKTHYSESANPNMPDAVNQRHPSARDTKTVDGFTVSRVMPVNYGMAVWRPWLFIPASSGKFWSRISLATSATGS